MRVTKSSERDDLIDLKVLAIVLNFDFEASSARDLEGLSAYPPTILITLNRCLPKATPTRRSKRAEHQGGGTAG